MSEVQPHFDLPPEPLRESQGQSVTEREKWKMTSVHEDVRYLLFLGKTVVLARVSLDGFDGDLW